MDNMQEIPCSVIKEIDGIKYAIRRYGLNGVVYEEELIPIPTEKIIKYFKKDGTEDLELRETKPIIIKNIEDSIDIKD